MFEAAAEGSPIVPELWSQLRPGVVAGAPAGLLLFVFTRYSPREIAELAGRFDPPLLARMFYGGITEEVLLRWGMMTALTWLTWRLLQRREEVVRPAYVRLAIVLSSLVFGLGHLPVAHFLLGGFTPSTLFLGDRRKHYVWVALRLALLASGLGVRDARTRPDPLGQSFGRVAWICAARTGV